MIYELTFMIAYNEVLIGEAGLPQSICCISAGMLTLCNESIATAMSL